MSEKIRDAQVGLGIRSWIFSPAIARQQAERAELVGLVSGLELPSRLFLFPLFALALLACAGGGAPVDRLVGEASELERLTRGPFFIQMA